MDSLGRWSGSGLISLSQLALLGGSFDPVHPAHLHNLRSVAARLRPQSLQVIPCHQPPCKTRSQTSDMDRLAMLRNLPNVEVDAREFARDGLSYNYDTVSEYRQEQGPQVSLTFVIGADSRLGFRSWHRWSEILKLVNLLVLGRPNIEQHEALASSHRELRQHYEEHSQALEELGFAPSGKIAILDNAELEISAQTIRQHIADGGVDCAGWLTPGVAAYITAHKLYQERATRIH